MKKVVVAAFLMVAVLALFSGCDKKYGFSAQYIRTDKSTSEAKHNSLILINSSQKLQEYYDGNLEIYQFTRPHDNIMSFKEAIRKYDDEFFEKNILIVIVLTEGSGSIRHEVTSIVKNDDKIVININRKSPMLQTDDIATWHILLELKKGEIPESSEFSLNVNDPVYY